MLMTFFEQCGAEKITLIFHGQWETEVISLTFVGPCRLKEILKAFFGQWGTEKVTLITGFEINTR